MATEQKAHLSYLRITPRKARSVANLIKGLSVNEAEAQLLIERRRAAGPLLKLLRSAVANAKNNQKLDPNHLFISSIRVDEGPMLKRILPRARGSASPIQKKMSHVTLTLSVNQSLAPRFNIVVEKKTKLPPVGDGTTKERKGPKTEGEKEKKEVTEKKKRPNFFKRVFNPKARTSK